MSRLEVPLQHRMLQATGDIVLWGELSLSNQICLKFDGRSSVRSPRGVLVVEK